MFCEGPKGVFGLFSPRWLKFQMERGEIGVFGSISIEVFRGFLEFSVGLS